MKKSVLILAAGLFALSFNAQTASDKDRKFAKEAAEAGMKEVMLGQLAQNNGSSQDVKNLGKMMVDDHTKANNELMALASRKGIALPTALSEKEQKGYNEMAKKTGADFDKAYAKCMVKDHKKAVCLFKKEAKKGDDADLKTFASNTEPTLEHHKMMAEQTCKNVKKS